MPFCRYTEYMGGSNPLAALGLLLVAVAFGMIAVRTIRMPAIVAGLGLEWIAGWGYLAYWLADPTYHWDRVRLLWRLGFQMPVGGEGYLLLMLPAGLLAVAAGAYASSGWPVLPNAIRSRTTRARPSSRER